MKKLILFFCVIALGISVQAQVSTPTPNTTVSGSTTSDRPSSSGADYLRLNTIGTEVGIHVVTPTEYYVPYTDEAWGTCVIMRSGQLSYMQNGSGSPVTSEMKFSNGSRLSSDGMVTFKDGSKYKLREGQCIGNDGGILVTEYSVMQLNKDAGKRK